MTYEEEQFDRWLDQVFGDADQQIYYDHYEVLTSEGSFTFSWPRSANGESSTTEQAREEHQQKEGNYIGDYISHR